jgi:hypothetical protein
MELAERLLFDVLPHDKPVDGSGLPGASVAKRGALEFALHTTESEAFSCLQLVDSNDPVVAIDDLTRISVPYVTRTTHG